MGYVMQRVTETFFDIMTLAGCAAVVYGVAMISTAAAWIVAGIMCIILAGIGSLGGKKR